MPATTTRASASSNCGSWWSSRCRPATPTSATSLTSQFQASAVTRASSATGRSLVPAVTMTTRPSLGPSSVGPGHPERPPDGVVLALRERGPQVLGGSRVDPGDESALLVGQERPQDGLDLLGRLPLPEDDLRESAAQPAMEVDLGEPAGVLERLHADPVHGLVRREPPLLDVPEQFPQLMRVHRSHLEASDRIARQRLILDTRPIPLYPPSVPVRNRFELSCRASERGMLGPWT